MGTRVFVVDDHEVVREGLARAVEAASGLELVGTAERVSGTAATICDSDADVAIVDVRLPDGSGIELIRDVRSQRPEVRCIVFTSYRSDEAFFQSTVAGASGFVLKDEPLEAAIEAVRRVARGESLLTADVLDEVRREHEVLVPQDQILWGLTKQERRILGLVTEGRTNKEIASEMSLAEKTVRNYVSNVLAKLGMRNRTALAAHVARSMSRSTHEGGAT